MLNAYAMARYADRTVPAGLEEVARFVRWEYPRTSVDYVLAELVAAASAAPPGARRTVREALRAWSRGVRSLFNGHAASETTASKLTD